MASLVQRTRKLTLAWFTSSNNTNQRQQQETQPATDRDDAQVATVDVSAGEGEPKVEEDIQSNSLLEEGEAAGSSPGSPADSTSTSTTTTERGNTSVSDRSGQEDVALVGNKQTAEGKDEHPSVRTEALGGGGAQEGPSAKQVTLPLPGAKKVKSETQQRTKTEKKNESDEKESGDNAQRERRPTLFRLRTQSLANIFQRSSSLDSASATGEDGAVLDPTQADGPNEKAGLMHKEGGKWKTWKERWFILKDAKLYYRAADSNKLLGKIDLLTAKLSLEERYTNAEFEMRTCIVIVSREGGSRGSRVMSPRGKSTTRQYYLFAEEYFATGKWLEAMKRSVSRVVREERRRERAENESTATTGNSVGAGNNMSRSDGGVRLGAGSDLTRSASLWASATYTPTAHLVRQRSQDSLTPAHDETTPAKNETAKKELKKRKKDKKKRKQKRRDKEEKNAKEGEEAEPKDSEEAAREEVQAEAAAEEVVEEEIRPEPEGEKRSIGDAQEEAKEIVSVSPQAEAPSVLATGLASPSTVDTVVIIDPRPSIDTPAEETNSAAVPAP